MMKLLFFFILTVIVPLKLFSQYSLNTVMNLPRSDDHLQKQEVSYKAPGEKGVGIVWDFSELESISENYELKYKSFHTNSDTIVGIEHSTMYYYQLSGDSLILSGYENPTTLIRYTKPETLLLFPFPYGRSFTDYFAGKGYYCNRLGIELYGKSVVTADAMGTLVIPGGDTLRHVLRVHTLKKIVEEMKPIPANNKADMKISSKAFSKDSIEWHLAYDSLHLELNIWHWYVEGYRYPVFESVSSVICRSDERRSHFSVSFYYPPHEQYYDLDNDFENQRKRDEREESDNDSNSTPANKNMGYEDELIHYAYAFDGQNVLLNYSLKVNSNVVIGLYDIQGKQLSAIRKVDQAKGDYQQQLMLESLPSGEYLLRISVGNKVYGEKLLKN
ncbi:T9SS type A sorting domain-containing protein [Bacteroides sp.]